MPQPRAVQRQLGLLAMPRGAVVDAFASLLVLSLAAVRAPPGTVDDRSDGITHHDAEAASEVDVDCAAHGQAPHGILRRNLFTDRHHIAFDDRPVAIICPIVHQTPAFLEQIAAPISRFDAVRNRMRERHFYHVVRIAGRVCCPIAKRRTEAVDSHVVAQALYNSRERVRP